MLAEWLAASLHLAAWNGVCTSLEATVTDVDDAVRTGAAERIDIRSPAAQAIADELAHRDDLPLTGVDSLIVARGGSTALVHVVIGIEVCRTHAVRSDELERLRLRALGRLI